MAAHKQKRSVADGPGVVPQEYEMVPVDAIAPHPRNVNEGDVGQIIESIKANRFFGAVTVQKSTSRILIGKHRWLAAKDAGLAMLPVIWADVDDAAALRIMLVDNRSTRLGHDDPLKLSEVLQSILSECGDLTGTGFDQDDLDQIIADLGNSALGLDGQAGSDETGRLKEQFQVLVTCQSETQQGTLLERLNAEGYSCRALLS